MTLCSLYLPRTRFDLKSSVSVLNVKLRIPHLNKIIYHTLQSTYTLSTHAYQIILLSLCGLSIISILVQNHVYLGQYVVQIIQLA